MRHRLLSRAALIDIWQTLLAAQLRHICAPHPHGWGHLTCASCQSVQSLMDALSDAMARMRALGGAK